MKTCKHLILLFVLLSFSMSCGGKKSEWQGTVEEIDGVIVVKNPKSLAPSSSGFIELILKEDLCIGEEDGEEDFIFSQIRSVQVDEEENIYVLDSKEACIKVFDKDGNPIRTFGKKGQGPGEMQLPSRMYISMGKEILIYDMANSRISYFSFEGKCLREISTGKYRFARTIPDSKGNIIVQHSVPGDNFVTEIKKLDSNLEPIITIGSIEEERTPYVLNMVSPSLMVRVMNNDNIVWGYSLKYEINIVSPEGKTKCKINKEYDPVKITKEKQAEIIKELFGDREIPSQFKLKFPENYYPYYFIICGDEGRIYVRTYEEDAEGNFYYDVFDPEGKYIARFCLPDIDFLYVVKKNKMYSMVWEDAKGIPVVRRYDMEWK